MLGWLKDILLETWDDNFGENKCVICMGTEDLQSIGMQSYYQRPRFFHLHCLEDVVAYPTKYSSLKVDMALDVLDDIERQGGTNEEERDRYRNRRLQRHSRTDRR